MWHIKGGAVCNGWKIAKAKTSSVIAGRTGDVHLV